MRLPFSLRPFSTGSRGIRFSSPEEMAREFLFRKGQWSAWQASPTTIRPLVVSRRGNPDGLIAAASLEAIPDEQVTAGSSALDPKSDG